MKKVLFIDTVHPYLEEQLLAHQFEIQHYTGKSRTELAQILDQFDAAVIRSKFKLDQALLAPCTRLKLIARAGAGMENIDVTFAESKGITCINSPEGNRDAVGEHAIGMLLMLNNHLKRADNEVRMGVWKRAENRGIELMGRTMAIIGYGNTGKQMARKLSGFDMCILVFDPYVTVPETHTHVIQTDMATIFAEADFVSLHVPLTPETHYLVDAQFLQNFKKNIVLLNTSRGPCVHTQALVQGLQTGKVTGACLDVLEFEAVSFEQLDSTQMPPEMQYLIQAENVVLTPHIAGWTHDSNFKMSKVLFDKMMQYFQEAKE